MQNNYPRPSFCTLLNKFGDVELNCAEIGVDRGLNAICMLNASPKSKFILVDSYIFSEDCGFLDKEDMFNRKQQMLKNIEPFKNRVEFIEKPSVETAALFPDKSFDYVYIDGRHTYQAVKEDFFAWFPKVKDFGIIAGHDFHFAGIKQAVLNSINNTLNLYIWGIEIMIPNTDKPRIPSDYINNSVDWWIHKEVWK